MGRASGILPQYLLSTQREMAQVQTKHGFLISRDWCGCLIRDQGKTETLGTRQSQEEACGGPMEVSTNCEGLCVTC